MTTQPKFLTTPDITFIDMRCTVSKLKARLMPTTLLSGPTFTISLQGAAGETVSILRSMWTLQLLCIGFLKLWTPSMDAIQIIKYLLNELLHQTLCNVLHEVRHFKNLSNFELHHHDEVELPVLYGPILALKMSISTHYPIDSHVPLYIINGRGLLRHWSDCYYD